VILKPLGSLSTIPITRLLITIIITDQDTDSETDSKYFCARHYGIIVITSYRCEERKNSSKHRNRRWVAETHLLEEIPCRCNVSVITITNIC